MKRLLVKKWRVGEVWLRDLDVSAGVYVDPKRGGFYSLVPELEPEDGGKLLSHSDRYTLEDMTRAALREHYGLQWRQAIIVTYPSPTKWRGSILRGAWSGSRSAWDPEDPGSASDELGPLQFEHVEIAEGPGGLLFRYLRTEDQARRGIEPRILKLDNPRDSWTELPYSIETWQALQAFKLQLRVLDHKIRTLLKSDDVLPKLLSWAAQGNLLTSGDER